MKIKPFQLIFAAVFLTIFAFLSACEKEEIEGTEYLIEVDSIQHPSTITTGDVLTIRFFGQVGDNDCYAYYKCNVSFEENLINAAVIGLYNETEDCTPDEIFLQDLEANVFSLPEGEFIIRVQLPRNMVLESNLTVTTPG